MICRLYFLVVCAVLLGAMPALAQEPFDSPSFSTGSSDASLPFLSTESAPPALRLLYTADTRGALFPCPT